jgi:hypothetical protein
MYTLTIYTSIHLYHLYIYTLSDVQMERERERDVRSSKPYHDVCVFFEVREDF